MIKERLEKLDKILNSDSRGTTTIPRWVMTCVAASGLLVTVSCASNKKEEPKTLETKTITATGVYGAPMKQVEKKAVVIKVMGSISKENNNQEPMSEPVDVYGAPMN